MKKVIITVMLFTLGCGYALGGEFFAGSFDEALQQAAKLNKPVFVDFYSNT